LAARSVLGMLPTIRGSIGREYGSTANANMAGHSANMAVLWCESGSIEPRIWQVTLCDFRDFRLISFAAFHVAFQLKILPEFVCDESDLDAEAEIFDN
jgi:hypothetical protein